MSRAVRLHLLALVIGLLPALAIAVAGCGGGGGSTTVIETVTETTGGGAGGGEAGPGRLVHFQSPSGNIGCVVWRGTARCDIDKHGWTPPPRPADCRLDYGQGIALGSDGSSEFVCAGDTTLDPKAPILAYGESEGGGGVTCASSEAGVTCKDGDGHGFFISVQGYKLY
jgi:hypothetical protein